MVRNVYRFDLFAVNEGSEEHHEFLELFQQVKPFGSDYTSKTVKGILRIIL